MANTDEITNTVNQVYSERARVGTDATYAVNVASAVGYTPEQLSSLPAGSNLGLSCGNPVATASLAPGEVVVDLGSGGGLDIFLAAERVGPTGIAIGLDGSEDMVKRARKNAKEKGLQPPHVAFVHAQLTEELPIESSTVDCIISNCVVNLLPLEGKAALLKEVLRVLKPNGRIYLDDIIAKKPFPDEIRSDLTNYVNCISGAITLDEYRRLLQEAGFSDITMRDTENDLDVYYQGNSDVNSGCSSCCCSVPKLGTAAKPNFNVNDWIASYQIVARKSSVNSDQLEGSTTVLKRWWDAYPTVRSSPASLTAEEVASLIRDPTKTHRDFTVVDVRRNDHAGGHVRGSFQCPAQTFYDDAPQYFERFKNSEKVIFYCQSSNGRGPRCAGWYQDYLDSVGYTTSKAYVLSGGIKQWMSKFTGQGDLVDYD